MSGLVGNNFVGRMLPCLLGLYILTSFTHLHAQSAKIKFDIPSQPLEEALTEFAQQSGVQLIYRSDILENAFTREIQGEIEPEKALERLLQYSKVQFRWVNPRTIALTANPEKVITSRPPNQDEVDGEASKLTEVAPNLGGVATPPNDVTEQYTDSDISNGEVPAVVIVTGTRIPRGSQSTMTPMTVLDGRQIEFSGVSNAVDLVNELPSIGPGLTNSNTNFTFTNAGQNILNLRNLGTERTLVLVDGRRHVGSLPGTTAVDIGTIPAALIERIDVITGGASPIYGADAVSGVVNFVMKRDFEGVQLDAQSGIATGNAEQEYSLSATFGGKFGSGRGNVVANLSYSDVDGIKPSDRRFARAALEFLPNPDNTGPADGVPDLIAVSGVRNVNASVSGVVSLPVDPTSLTRTEGQTSLFTFDENGRLRPFDFGGGLVAEGRHTGVGDGDIVNLRDMLRVPVERRLATLFTSYEFADDHRFLLDLKFTEVLSEASFQPVFDLASLTEESGLGITLSADNPFIQDDLRAILLGDPNDPSDDIESIGISRTHLEFGDRGQKVDRRTVRTVFGVEGPLSDLWSYEAFYQYGRSRSRIIKLNDRIQARFEQSLDAVLDPTSGEIVCRDQSSGCQPFNPLGAPGIASEGAVGFSSVDTEFREILTQQVAQAAVSGTIFELPGGSVAAAFGAEYRKESSESRPSLVSQLGQGFFNTRLSPVIGSYDVSEAFAEMLIPLQSGQRLVEELTLEAAVRWADYTPSGSATSWRVGGKWAPVTGIAFRGVFANAVRAPNIGELFQPETEGFPRVADPCDQGLLANTPNRAANCAALGIPDGYVQSNPEIGQRTISLGNPDLAVEKAKTVTLGLLIQPTLIPGLSVNLDYWQVRINQAISSFSPQSILDNCVDAASINNPFCQSIRRSSTGSLEFIRTQTINVSDIKSRGLDLDLNYLTSIGKSGNLGAIQLGLTGTYLDRLDFFLPSDVIDQQAGEVGLPKWRFRSDATYSNGPFALNLSSRFIGSVVRDVQEPLERRFPHSTGAEWYFDAQLRYQLEAGMDLFVGANNVFDNSPPTHPDTFQGGTGLRSNAIIYDNIGQFIYTGVRASF